MVGIDKSKSGSINIQIENKEIVETRFILQTDAELFPESEFPKAGRRLRGFDWRGEERPMSVEDLFKDDPPLVLPKIKGLDDYVPPEEFIDDAVTERIEEAGKITPEKENKAARNLPKPAPATALPLTKVNTTKPISQAKQALQKNVKKVLKEDVKKDLEKEDK